MIVTVSRQFASGGREIGKRLADELNLRYYDREIVTEIAKNVSLDEKYVSNVLAKGYGNISLVFAHSLPLTTAPFDTITDVLIEQQKIIKTIGEQGNCLIVGRNADVILRDLHPVRLFVYADDASKIKRCRERERDGEDLSDKKLLKRFKEIDKGREKLHDLLSGSDWGAKEAYDILVNTSGVDIKSIIPSLAKLIENYKKI